MEAKRYALTCKPTKKPRKIVMYNRKKIRQQLRLKNKGVSHETVLSR